MYGLLAMALIMTSSLGIATYAVEDMKRATNEQKHIVAYEVASAGLEQAVAQAYASLNANGGAFVSATYNLSSTLAPIATGCSVTATVQPQATPTMAWITSTATVNGITKSLRTMVSEHNVGIWNNAIFAGSGAAGASINGNVDIAGSVHILGDGEPFIDLNGDGVWEGGDPFTDTNNNGVWDPGEPYSDIYGFNVYTAPEPYNDLNGNGKYDPPMTITSLDTSFGGTAFIENNYNTMPLSLQLQVPAAPVVSGVQTLGAEVRCKHGKIGISGNASIGASGIVNGGTMKGTVDGVYVTDGWAGNQGAAHVYSDNGTSNPYDLGGLGIEYPVISGIGAQAYTASDGSSWTTQDGYLSTDSLLCPVTNITSSTTAFTYGPDAYGNKISFTPKSGATNAQLTVTGIVRFSSNIQIGGKNDNIDYSGSGTLYAPNIYIDGNLLPKAGLIFPTTARIGLISKQNMYLSTGNGSSQISMAGAFYAQGDITSAKQNQIAGTFVANFFNMGTNVPNIYQVPSLPYHMPPGMPGDKSYFTLKLQGWRERQ